MSGIQDAERNLEDLKTKEEEELAQVLSHKYGVEYIDLTRVSINADALGLIHEEKAREAECAAFDMVGKKISLAVRSPQHPKLAAVVGALEEGHYTVTEFMCSRASLEHAWERYKELSLAISSSEGVFDISGKALRETMEGLTSTTEVVRAIERVLQLKKTYRVSKILEIVLAGALATDASDIHIEPEQYSVRVRYRLDGVLLDVTVLDHDTYLLLLSRIKLLSGLKLNVHDRAQDGRFSVNPDAEAEIEVRTSVIPEAYGESVVLRLLNPNSIGTPLEELGMEPGLKEIVEAEIRKPNGMLLTTGPTGSGKTTALYACMKKVANEGVKIITIEDPIEYHVKGIVQTQVGPEYTFIGGLRSALRQDPDVIMIGEIRDAEVARTAIDAALTGHFVFSTLHTNNAAGSFPRLADFNIDLKVVGSAMTVILAQRLVRRLCQVCKKEIPFTGDIKAKIDKALGRVKKINPNVIPTEPHIYQSIGCPECNATGYKGRIGIFEGIQVDEEIEHLVRDNPSERDIQFVQKTRPLLLIHEDGLVKVLSGITTLEELERVVTIED